MTADRIAEIRARAEKATAGPWAVEEQHGRDCIWLDVVNVATEDEIFNGETLPQEHIVCVDYRERLMNEKEHEIANLEFVAHARTDIPDLLAHVTELETQLAEAQHQRGLLEWAVKAHERNLLAHSEALAAPHPDTARLDKLEALRGEIDSIEGPPGFPGAQWSILLEDRDTTRGRTLREAIDALEGQNGK